MQGWRIRVRGQVQGVGFRPFVWALAQEMGLSGRVLNDPEGVLIEVAGDGIDRFAAALRDRAPPLARVDAVEMTAARIAAPGPEFVIAPSQGVGAETRVTPDAATCAACAAEIRDPTARRYRHAFANCTHCGPRFTILQALPYDRARTSMAAFAMCADCAAEYADPRDRRFHAQPIACPACGPRLWYEAEGAEVSGDPLALAAAALGAGKVVAIKGLGGFHLACDATDAAAIATLRARKQRPGKPLALMAPLPLIRAHAAPSAPEAALLADPAAPIVLLSRAGQPLPEALAPGLSVLGWMLPYTPLHHLLCDLVGRPLVMTSGNLSGEPQVIDNADARAKLAGFADGFVMHDRAIRRRIDDSVERIGPVGPMVLRRARGRVPGTLPLPPGFAEGPQVLAFGGQMKAAICLTKGASALLSHHLGDLDEALTVADYDRALADHAALFDHRPELAACDLHPGLVSTARAEASGLPVIPVQHHHAHLAACLGDNNWPRDGDPVAGIVLDGLGLGTDGTIWGGELLLGGYAAEERVAHLAPAPLAGGDRAAVEPWRNALVRLDAAGLGELADRLFPAAPRALLRQAVASGINAPLSSSVGRLFDAVAAVLGLCPDRQSHEGEAAMRLEALAEVTAPALSFGGSAELIDPAPLFRALATGLAQGVPRAALAGGFQRGLAEAFCDRARALVQAGRAEAVALTGGCFQNAALLRLCLARLDGLRVLVHGPSPCNDGGLAWGQALVALAARV